MTSDLPTSRVEYVSAPSVLKNEVVAIIFYISLTH